MFHCNRDIFQSLMNLFERKRYRTNVIDTNIQCTNRFIINFLAMNMTEKMIGTMVRRIPMTDGERMVVDMNLHAISLL